MPSLSENLISAPLSRRAAREALQARAAQGAEAAPVAEVPASEPDAQTPAPDEVPEATQVPVPSIDDPFVTASTLFATREIEPIRLEQSVAEPVADAPHVVRRRPRIARRVAAGAATAGIMGLACMLAVSMTLPAEALAAAQGARPASAVSIVAQGATADRGTDEIQAFVAPGDVENDSLVREEGYSSVSLLDIAQEQGIRYSDALYTNDPDAAIQWPFVVGVGMSSGYGERWGRLHAGIDLIPGEGAPIQVIADGVVRTATESGGAYGVTAYVDHVIDGKVVTSHYSHMQYGSLRVKAGDKVKVGDIVGNTGNTGRSYGAHLHFEIIVNGSKIDPLPWMQKNAGRYDGVTPVS